MKKLETIRAEISAIKQEIDATERAALTDEQIAARVSDWFDSQARVLDETMLDRTYGLIQPATGAGIWPEASDAVRYKGPELAVALSVTANRQWLEPILLGKAQARADQEGQVADKPSVLARLRKKLYELEVKEEAIITELEQAGETVYRRGDADPAAILGLGHQ